MCVCVCVCVCVSKLDFLWPLPYYLTGCSSHGTSFEDDLTLGAEGKWHSSLQLGLRKKLFMG